MTENVPKSPSQETQTTQPAHSLGPVATNATISRITDVLARNAAGGRSWSERLIQTDLVMGTFIYQEPGLGNKRHYHATDDEFWVVLRGQLKWEFGDRSTVDETVIAGPGDVVLARVGRWHSISVVGDEPAIRFAVVTPDVAHLAE